MAQIHMKNNQGTPMPGDHCAFRFLGNVGAPLMVTLNMSPGFTLETLVWFFPIPNVLNALNASKESTLYYITSKRFLLVVLQ